MSKKDLIERIMNEVKDEELRDKLLAEVISDTRSANDDSIILSELEKLGLDAEAAKQYTKSNIKISIITSYIVGGIFFVGGSLVTIGMVASGNFLVALFPGFFAAMGWYAISNGRKLSRIVK